MKHDYNALGGGANSVAPGYSKGTALGAEIIGTSVLVLTVFSATDPKRSASNSPVPVLAPLPIGFAVLLVHLATIPITGTGINPARSFGAAIVYNNEKVWDYQEKRVNKAVLNAKERVGTNQVSKCLRVLIALSPKPNEITRSLGSWPEVKVGNESCQSTSSKLYASRMALEGIRGSKVTRLASVKSR